MEKLFRACPRLGGIINLCQGEYITSCASALPVIHCPHCKDKSAGEVLADTMEAVFAAIFIDSKKNGSDEYKSVIISLFEEEFSGASATPTPDYKTMLQQFVEKDGSATLAYETVAENGPEHKKEFIVIAKVNNNIVGRGSAFSKKNAEMEAAKAALLLFGFKL
jgi:ribonuclease-3